MEKNTAMEKKYCREKENTVGGKYCREKILLWKKILQGEGKYCRVGNTAGKKYCRDKILQWKKIRL